MLYSPSNLALFPTNTYSDVYCSFVLRFAVCSVPFNESTSVVASWTSAIYGMYWQECKINHNSANKSNTPIRKLYWIGIPSFLYRYFNWTFKDGASWSCSSGTRNVVFTVWNSNFVFGTNDYYYTWPSLWGIK